MPKSSKASSTKSPAAKRAARTRDSGTGKRGKRRTNLTLDAYAVAGGEEYSKRHGTNLSQLVNGFLHRLVVRETHVGTSLLRDSLVPAVNRLFGVASASGSERDGYYAYLDDKYGGQR